MGMRTHRTVREIERKKKRKIYGHTQRNEGQIKKKKG